MRERGRGGKKQQPPSIPFVEAEASRRVVDSTTTKARWIVFSGEETCDKVEDAPPLLFCFFATAALTASDKRQKASPPLLLIPFPFPKIKGANNKDESLLRKTVH